MEKGGGGGDWGGEKGREGWAGWRRVGVEGSFGVVCVHASVRLRVVRSGALRAT